MIPTTVNPPLYQWLNKRASGVLLHPTSLAGDFGVGSFGEDARAFIDFLAETRMRYWQICPLGPTGYGDSPYQTFSAFAGNPYLIDLLELCERKIIPSDALGPLLFLPSDHTDYGALYTVKWPILFEVCRAFRKIPADRHPYGNFEEFKDENAYWLESYAYFHALKQHFEGAPWYEWPAEFRTFADARKNASDDGILERIEHHRILQYLFFGQWKKLKRYANHRNVRIIGDMPIFASFDSADVWAHPEIFRIDPRSGRAIEVAGVPPDYFSNTGQMWGNPLYDWKALKRSGFEWWIERFRVNFSLCDVVRIDHFRGFHDYWAIPHDAPDARSGKWEKGPGLGFFKAVKDAFPKAKMIAEDLGDLSEGVHELRKHTGLPGMAIFQFAFGGESDNLYLPHHHSKNCVVYPGTHDNNTTIGWYRRAGEPTKDHVRRYLRVSGEEINWDLIRAAYRSPARLAVIPMQDLMSLGEGARMNTPGAAEGNWKWRYRHSQLEALRKRSSGYLNELAELYDRAGDED